MLFDYVECMRIVLATNFIIPVHNQFFLTTIMHTENGYKQPKFCVILPTNSH